MESLHEPVLQQISRLAGRILIALLLALPPAGRTASVTLSKQGPATAREGDLVEYLLEVTNTDSIAVAGLEVLDSLPDAMTFVQATTSPGGDFDPASGIWALPVLEAGATGNTAALTIQLLVDQGLLAGPADVVNTTNRAELVAPAAQLPLEAQAVTNIVCSFCIDWEIMSVRLDEDYRGYPDPAGFRILLDVEVANNGPVTSEANVSVSHFEVSGGGIGSPSLHPDLPVAVSLAPGETATVPFATSWLDWPKNSYTISWEFAINDTALMDPVLPNSAAGSWTGKVGDGGGSGGGGCFIATAAYGSYLHPHVRSLRRFRDKILLRSRPGRLLVAWYYRNSPPLAACIEHSETLKFLTRLVLAPLVFAVEHMALAATLLCGLPVLLALRKHAARRRAA